MEENFEKGIIAEEALDEVAGGIGISTEILKKAFISVGVAIAAGTVIGATTSKIVKNKSEEGSISLEIPETKDHIINKDDLNGKRDQQKVKNIREQKSKDIGNMINNMNKKQ